MRYWEETSFLHVKGAIEFEVGWCIDRYAKGSLSLP